MRKNIGYGLRTYLTCALILSTSVFCMAGAVDGPKKYSGTLKPETAGTHPTDFVGGQEAKIVIRCNGAFRVTVHDQDGNKYGHTDEPARTELTVTWMVPTTQKFFISIFHRDDNNKDISYTIETN